MELANQNHEQCTSMARTRQLDAVLSGVGQDRWFLQEHGNIETIRHYAKFQLLNGCHQFYKSEARLSGKMNINHSWCWG